MQRGYISEHQINVHTSVGQPPTETHLHLRLKDVETPGRVDAGQNTGAKHRAREEDAARGEDFSPLRPHRQHHRRDEAVHTAGLAGKHEDCRVSTLVCGSGQSSPAFKAGFPRPRS